MPFLEQNIQNENWQIREACIMAFIQCLEGPSKEYLTRILDQVRASVEPNGR